MPYSTFLGVSSFICFIIYFLSVGFLFIVDLPADSFFIAKADFFLSVGKRKEGGRVSPVLS